MLSAGVCWLRRLVLIERLTTVSKIPSKSPEQSAQKAIREARPELYATRRFLERGTQASLGIRLAFDVFFQDPYIAAVNAGYNFDGEFAVPWEPGFGDGPTSARFAVVDYDGTTETLENPAKWDVKTQQFTDPVGKILDRHNIGGPQFRQLNVWATLQYALDFFESGFGLGRRIDWGFEGNRLIVVPQAGYGENAYYDRESKSLQFYYFDRDVGGKQQRTYTCLSADIINHEFAHAVLDGIRPHFHESVFAETAAFHEYAGDAAAILIAFRNNAFRAQVLKATGGDLDKDNPLASLAEEFGKGLANASKNAKVKPGVEKPLPYLRSALNTLTYSDIKGDQRHHYMSQVLTGAMFDIIRKLNKHYLTKAKLSPKEALWSTIRRMQCMAVQPLDLLPPVDVTFHDYAMAMLRAEQIVNPTDPDGYREIMIDVFEKRGILSKKDATELRRPVSVFQRLGLAIDHDPTSIVASRANAYRFLDDNRRDLYIPFAADVTIVDVSIAQKLVVSGRRQPQQVLLQYIWREDVQLEGTRFGRFAGKTASMLCGGTLALDVDGNVLSWQRKPGSLSLIKGTRLRQGEVEEVEAGKLRREAFLDALAARVAAGRVGDGIVGGAIGLLEKTVSPLTAHEVDGSVRFALSPHIGIHSDEDEEMGERPWSISS